MRKWFLDKIDLSDAGLESCTKLDASNKDYFLRQSPVCDMLTDRCDFLDNIFETTTKGFFDNALRSIEDFFTNLKNRIERLIFNVVSLVQTEVKKINLKVHGIEKYQIVLSNSTNACDRCKEMDGQIFNVDELKVSDTAPPFHPNCDCTIIMKRTSADIDEPLDLIDPSGEYDREKATQYAMQWFNGQNPEYPSFGGRGDCANFVSQCLVAGGFKMNTDIVTTEMR